MNMHTEKLNAQYALAILWTSISIVIVLAIINMHISKIGWTLCAHVNRQFRCSITASLASRIDWRRCCCCCCCHLSTIISSYFNFSMDFLWINFKFFFNVAQIESILLLNFCFFWFEKQKKSFKWYLVIGLIKNVWVYKIGRNTGAAGAFKTLETSAKYKSI